MGVKDGLSGGDAGVDSQVKTIDGRISLQDLFAADTDQIIHGLPFGTVDIEVISKVALRTCALGMTRLWPGVTG